MAKKKQHRVRLSRRTIVTTVIVLVVLAVAVGAGFLAQFLQRQSQQSSVPDEFTITGGPPLPGSVRDAQNLAASGNSQEANKKIEEALAANPDATTTYELHIQRGINYQNESKNAEAMAEYRLAEAIKQDFKVVRLIAELSRMMGNNAVAIEYYKKAIELVNPENPLRDSEIERFETRIKELGG